MLKKIGLIDEAVEEISDLYRGTIEQSNSQGETIEHDDNTSIIDLNPGDTFKEHLLIDCTSLNQDTEDILMGNRPPIILYEKK